MYLLTRAVSIRNISIISLGYEQQWAFGFECKNKKCIREFVGKFKHCPNFAVKWFDFGLSGTFLYAFLSLKHVQ